MLIASILISIFAAYKMMEVFDSFATRNFTVYFNPMRRSTSLTDSEHAIAHTDQEGSPQHQQSHPIPLSPWYLIFRPANQDQFQAFCHDSAMAIVLGIVSPGIFFIPFILAAVIPGSTRRMLIALSVSFLICGTAALGVRALLVWLLVTSPPLQRIRLMSKK